MGLIKQSASYTKTFLMVRSGDHITGLIGSTSVTVNVSKAGASFASTNAVISEVGNGYYKAALTSTDTNTSGDLSYHFTDAANADPTDVVDQIIAFDPFDAVRLGLSAIPNVASGSAGAIPTTGTGANQISVTNGLVAVNSSQSVLVSAPVTVGTNNDKTGYSLSVAPPTSAQITGAVLTTQMTESYAALHTVPTLAQAVFEMRGMMGEKAVNGSSVTVLQIDGATTAETFYLDSTSPTQIHRAS